MKPNLSVIVFLTLLLLAASCTKRRATPGEVVSDAAPSPSPSSSISTAPFPPPPTGPLPPQDGVVCSKVACDSGVTVIARLQDSPAVLAAHGSFRMCHAADCWDGTFLARSAPGDVGACRITPSSYVPSYPPRCVVREEGPGSRLEITRGGGRFVDGERVSLRVVVGRRTVVDQERHVTYERHYVNGPACGPMCWNATVEL